MKVVCVILAAGRSSRMGAQKLLLPIGGTAMLDRAIEAAAGFPTVAVISPSLAMHVPATVTVVVNVEPERGMSHSLALAEAAIGDRDAAIAVLLADTPLVDAALVRRVVGALGEADVAYPVREGRGGHPVVFGPRTRSAMRALADGDSLRSLRDEPRWARIEVPVESTGAFTDVDSPADLARLAAAIVEPSAAPAKS